MAYFADLTRYEYWDDNGIDNGLNVGWLSGQQAFQMGNTTSEFQERLLKFCNGLVRPTRGWHYCELCPQQPASPRAGNPLRPLGTAEIRVFFQQRIYAAPNLIHHYVTEHHYRPPDEFIEAVINGPLPGSPEYETLIQSLGIEYRVIDLEELRIAATEVPSAEGRKPRPPVIKWGD